MKQKQYKWKWMKQKTKQKTRKRNKLKIEWFFIFCFGCERCDVSMQCIRMKETNRCNTLNSTKFVCIYSHTPSFTKRHWISEYAHHFRSVYSEYRMWSVLLFFCYVLLSVRFHSVSLLHDWTFYTRFISALFVYTYRYIFLYCYFYSH